MSKMYLYEKQQTNQKITHFILQELKVLPTKDASDFILNKGQYQLDSEQVHKILACIADNTGISIIILRRVFPYNRYFVTWKASWLIPLGCVILIVATVNLYTDLFPFLFLLSLCIWFIAFLKYILICVIRSGKPILTTTLFTEIIITIIDQHRDDLAFGIQMSERQMWRNKIYEVFSRYLHIFGVEEFSPGLIVPLADPDELEMGFVLEECAEVMSLSFEEIDQSGIYAKYTSYDDDELLTIVHFADLLIEFWAGNKRDAQ